MLAKRNLSPHRALDFVLLLFFAGVSALCLPASGRADALEDAARSLARKVATIPQLPRPLSLHWQTNGSLAEPQSNALRSVFESGLRAAGVELVPAMNSSHELGIKASTTPSQILLVAEVRTSDSLQARIVSVRREGLSISPGNVAAGPRLEKKFLVRRNDAVLAVAEIPQNTPELLAILVLSRDSLTRYRFSREATLSDSMPLPVQAAPSRDLRGEVRLRDQQAEIVLPRQTCDANVADSLVLNCRSGSTFSEDRVFLRCSPEAAPWRLASDQGDRTVPDRLLLRDPTAEEADAPSEELDLPGPVLSLSGNPNFSSAVVVVFNLSSGSYEIYRITLACGN